MNELLRRMLFLPPQGSTVAAEIDALHYFVILTTLAGAVLVTLVGGTFLIKYRRRSHGERHPHPGAGAPKSRAFRALEISAVGSLATLFFLWWSIGVRQFTRLRVAPANAMDVYVTGKQWMWKFAYPRGNHSISDLIVPVGTPVRLILTSRDVIHSFYVPDFRVKEDAVPGRYTTLWFQVDRPGVHDIFCTQYCGTGHSSMRGQVVALPAADFERWLAGERAPARLAGKAEVHPFVVGENIPAQEIDLARMGERVAADLGCLRCHSVDGTRHIGPTWAGMYGARVALAGGGQAIADEAYITESMMDPGAKLHAGFDNVMPSFQGRVRPADVGALLEYIKSLRDVAPEPGGRDEAAAKLLGDAGLPDSGAGGETTP